MGGKGIRRGQEEKEGDRRNKKGTRGVGMSKRYRKGLRGLGRDKRNNRKGKRGIGRGQME